MSPSPADWQLPPGVDRGLWEYLQDSAIARNYDASLAHSSLFRLDQLFALQRFERAGRLVDLGCGTGRLAVEFARRGFWVLAVDLSEEMLRVTGEKAAAVGTTVHRLRANLVELDALRDQSFDYAACLFSTLGMIRGCEQRRQALRHVHRILRPGGAFILHVHNRWFNFWDPNGRRWLMKDLFRSLMNNPAAGDRLQPVHQGIANLTLHLFTRREALRLLRESGFRIVEVLPVGLSDDGRLAHPWWFGALRAYGYLIAAER